MSRAYYVTLGSTIVNTPTGAEVVEDEQVMTVRGHTVKFVMAGGSMLLCQVVDRSENILFVCPASLVKSVWTPTGADENDDNVHNILQLAKEED